MVDGGWWMVKPQVWRRRPFFTVHHPPSTDSREGAAVVRERAEPDRSAPAPVIRAAALAPPAWLAPCAASLTLLARRPTPSTWDDIRGDPGAVLLLLRQPTGGPPPDDTRLYFLTRLLDPAVLEDAAALLDPAAGGFVDWNAAAVRPVYDVCLALARLAQEEAERTGECPAETAWACGLLAPLGWLGACAADPAAVAACLADPAFADGPARTQRRLWGLDQAALARRLARTWRLPRWLAGVVGRLDLPSELAVRLGADPVLSDLTRRAVGRAREQGVDLGLCREAAAPARPHDANGRARPAQPWQSPYERPLLRDLLLLAAENRRLYDAPRPEGLEPEIDRLHQALADQAAGAARRLRDGKLAALAEFAAGAGHEINNPLAVISGQAQYLMGRPAEWHQEEPEAARKSLQTIIAQTQRVAGLLRDLMQFARPAAPRPGWFDLPMLLAHVAAGLDDQAARRNVRVEVGRTPERLAVYADAEQVRVAVSCLLRNAVEAAPADGWARVGVVEPVGETAVVVAVEDSGPGPDAVVRAALFDPFYSGRPAGRGRGLGLPTAWRLARLQGGDVTLEPARPDGPTRFLLALPRAAEPAEAA
jgi:signal transduction histidine kinase